MLLIRSRKVFFNANSPSSGVRQAAQNRELQLETLLDGNGVTIRFFLQSLKSVDNVYEDERRKTLINSARVDNFFGAQDADDLP
jgi:hypothetical protein